ncbi:MAG: hypothetical protein ACLFWI_27635 [Coleofasciculus sp.]|uniref:hypothetical protein n=1 Tax=Coleofasciculus sp. TaxID=3100458 RepID=UPI003A19FA29
MAVFFFRYINLDEKGGSAIHPPREFIVRSPFSLKMVCLKIPSCDRGFFWLLNPTPVIV